MRKITSIEHSEKYDSYYSFVDKSEALGHHGTKGMHWGERLYQYKDGSLTPLGRIHYGIGKKRNGKDLVKPDPKYGNSAVRKNEAYKYLDERSTVQRKKFNPKAEDALFFNLHKKVFDDKTEISELLEGKLHNVIGNLQLENYQDQIRITAHTLSDEDTAKLIEYDKKLDKLLSDASKLSVKEYIKQDLGKNISSEELSKAMSSEKYQDIRNMIIDNETRWFFSYHKDILKEKFRQNKEKLDDQYDRYLRSDEAWDAAIKNIEDQNKNVEWMSDDAGFTVPKDGKKVKYDGKYYDTVEDAAGEIITKQAEEKFGDRTELAKKNKAHANSLFKSGKSIKEIAEIMDIPLGTVNSYLYN